MAKTKGRIIKCEGRFHELRDFLYSEVFPLALGERTVVTEKDLKEAWDLSEIDRFTFDMKDPYYNDPRSFNGPKDTARKPSLSEPISLVPLIERPVYSLEDSELIKKYAISMGNSEELATNLSNCSSNPRGYLETTLGITPSRIPLPPGGNLKGYVLSSDQGIGTIVSGGSAGGGIRSDAPFLLGVYEQPHRGELGLVAVIGFWAQNDEMLISQIQSCGNGHFPRGTQFGVGALSVAEAVARKLGFKKITTYSARNHPIFTEYPEDWNQFGKDFVCIYDNSAKKLGYDGGRHSGAHEKNLVGTPVLS